MNIFNRKRQLNLIDLHDYEGRLLLQKDRGVPAMPPPPPIVDKSNLTAEEWERIQRNYRMAQEIYNHHK